MLIRKPAEIRRDFLGDMHAIWSVAQNQRLPTDLTSMSRGIGFDIDQQIPTALVYKGLSVIGFTRFDAFVSEICRSYVFHFLSPRDFSTLPLPLRTELTIRSISAFNRNLKFIKDGSGGALSDEAKVSKALEFSSAVGIPVSGSVYDPSEFSFLPSGYDVSGQDLNRFLKCFGGRSLDDITKVLKRLGSSVGTFGASSSFENARKQRDDSAHNSSQAVSSSDLSKAIDDLVQIAFAFETLVLVYCAGSRNEGGEPRVIGAADVPLSIVEYRKSNPSCWHLTRPGASRATVASSDQMDALRRTLDHNAGSSGLNVKPVAVLCRRDNRVLNWVTRIDTF